MTQSLNGVPYVRKAFPFNYNIATFDYIRFLTAAELCRVKNRNNGLTEQHHLSYGRNGRLRR